MSVYPNNVLLVQFRQLRINVRITMKVLFSIESGRETNALPNYSTSIIRQVGLLESQAFYSDDRRYSEGNQITDFSNFWTDFECQISPKIGIILSFYKTCRTAADWDSCEWDSMTLLLFTDTNQRFGSYSNQLATEDR